MLLDFLLLIASLAIVIKSADFTVRYSTKIAEGFKLPKYIVGFLIVAVISVLPEAMVSINAAIQGVPALGLGTLFGSNVADLTLVLAITIFLANRGLKIENRLLENKWFHIIAIAIPLLLGLNGSYSRFEGILLIITGLSFYAYILRRNKSTVKTEREPFSYKNLFLFLLSLGVLILGANLAVQYGASLAEKLKINPVFVGMFIIGLGTILPELTFSIKAAKQDHDDLALGDILGTVVADATIVVGLIAIISPFSFAPQLIYVTGLFMFLAMVLLFYFMKSDKVLSKREALCLILFYILFVIAELFFSGLY